LFSGGLIHVERHQNKLCRDFWTILNRFIILIWQNSVVHDVVYLPLLWVITPKAVKEAFAWRRGAFNNNWWK